MRKKLRLKGLKAILARKSRRDRGELYAAAGVSLVVVCIFVASTLGTLFIRSGQYASVVAAVLVDLANGDRATHDLDRLSVSPVLAIAAQKKANDMAAKSYFAHISPEGIDPWHWFKEAGYRFDYAGENLAVDFYDSSDVERAWMNSPTHRDNIMNPRFTEIGIAAAVGVYQGRTTTFVVQEFGTPASQVAPRPLVEESIPANPQEPALASAAPAVLGENAVAGASKETAVPSIAKRVAPPAPGAIVEKNSGWRATWWQHALASPRQTFHWMYYLLALLVVAALAFTTGFEIHWHHRGKAVAAGFSLALISVLFVIGEYEVFTDPILTARAVNTAAAGLAF